MNDSLSQLPEYDPHPDLWVRIEADLARNAESTIEPFSRVGHELPMYEPKTDLWLSIEKQLDTPTIRPIWNQPQIRWQWAGLVAAAAIFIVGAWLYLSPKSTEEIRIEYAVEQTDTQTPVAPAKSSEDKRAEEFIARQCAEQQRVCQRPEVHELCNQLVELSTEQQRIERERQTFGDDPVLVRAQVKIENQRAEIMKELITILRS